MYRRYEQSQPFLLPPSLQDFVGEGHPAHLINDLVDQLDLTTLEARYGNLGQPAYRPRLMVKVILYGFTVGVFSSRKLQRACQENLAFKYLAGMETPAFRTFIEFRQRRSWPASWGWPGWARWRWMAPRWRPTRPSTRP
jgi:transposase